MFFIPMSLNSLCLIAILNPFCVEVLVSFSLFLNGLRVGLHVLSHKKPYQK